MDSSSPRDFFSKHVEEYSKSKSHAEGSDLGRLIQIISPRSSDSVLDLGTGTGFTAIELARHVQAVTAVDITKEMILQARKLATEREMENVEFVLSDVSSLPFTEQSFNIVVTRRAAHHFCDLEKVLEESSIVMKSGGKLGIVDMSPPNGCEEFVNKIERLRDSTHSVAASPEEWQKLVKASGFDITHIELLDEDLTFEKWLSPVKPGGSEEKVIRSELARATTKVKTLMKVKEDSGIVLGWTKQLIILIAQKVS